VTESKKGIANRQEAFPLQIDPQYVVGWAWQRAYGFRVVKDFGKFAFGLGIEGPRPPLLAATFLQTSSSTRPVLAAVYTTPLIAPATRSTGRPTFL